MTASLEYQICAHTCDDCVVEYQICAHMCDDCVVRVTDFCAQFFHYDLEYQICAHFCVVCELEILASLRMLQLVTFLTVV